MDQQKIMSEKKYIRLHLNESSHFLNNQILNQLKKFNFSSLSLYPDYKKANSLIANYCKCKIEQILLTNGAEQAITVILSTLFKKGDSVLIPSPTFIAYHTVLSFIGAKPKVVLYKDKENNFIFPTSEVLNSINKTTKGILLCNPNNPLGSCISKKDISLILKKAKKFNIPVVVDEAYYEFFGQSSVNFLKTYKNLIIIRSFSKAFGVAGLRLGYIIADPSLIVKFSRIRLPRAVNHFAIFALDVLLKQKNHFRSQISQSLKVKKDLTNFLRKQGIKCYDSEANFIVLKMKNHRNFIKKLKSANILVSDISRAFYAKTLLKGAIRMTVPSGKDLKIIKKFFSKVT